MKDTADEDLVRGVPHPVPCLFLASLLVFPPFSTERSADKECTSRISLRYSVFIRIFEDTLVA